jgi:hypothetical protein
MNRFRKVLYAILIVLNIFLALAAILGGTGILAGVNVPSVEVLKGSIFRGYFIPGRALLVIVGGSASLATILLMRKNKYTILSSTVAAIIIMCFEFVEAIVIGSPPGVAQFLQLFYFGLGTVIASIAMGVGGIELLSK